ncbi:hypothetical protein B1757_11870 [Acidithiobacillus marinus]|uniref:Uncharacterized protein n=1 Tax=Acidithiobacillus marinus TaxID=187490 RepID=A0A2I1DJC7_9PROT|nr:hypothetical protein B1757_11870 [Acidithiobacillus marinus]
MAFEKAVLLWAEGMGWRLERTGPLRRGIWPVARLEFLREGVLTPENWDHFLSSCSLFESFVPGRREASSHKGIAVKFYQVEKPAWGFAQIAHTGPHEWVAYCRSRAGWDQLPAESEQAAFARIGLEFLPPEERCMHDMNKPDGGSHA